MTVAADSFTQIALKFNAPNSKSTAVAKAMKAAEQLGPSTISPTTTTNSLSVIWITAPEALPELDTTRENGSDGRAVVTALIKDLNLRKSGLERILCIREIRELWPGEKIIIVSEFVLFLDIIKEGIQRRGKTDAKFRFLLAEYNGSVNLETRSQVQFAFNRLGAGPEVLLPSAGAGGQGLNLARAAHIIITEPFWTPEHCRRSSGEATGFLRRGSSTFGI
ncbi:hypothetical protein FGADI_9012 [Fusarium gaditjirri]|uniref:Helicase C-terminal domain-containing protein n=1 Tax=Fusarium gaditjirri TaxID=282569 RepID=A0A8H4T0W4_9HYPO|nr:hypothetical protein FGADI_9012 [Fusarium gaditjirri]